MSSRKLVFPVWLVLAVVIALLGGASVSYADGVGDPLHGCSGVPSNCTDNGTVTIVNSNTPSYGFTVSPGPASGDYEIVTLIPNNIVGGGSEVFSVSGGAISPVSATLAGNWTSGDLATFLGLSGGASPANPLSAFLTTTQTFDPTATGYFVYFADLGTNTLLGPGGLTTATPVLSDGSFFIPNGSSIAAFLNEGVASPDWIATAPSGQLSIQGGGGPTPVPEPASLALLGTGILSLAGLRRRLSKHTPQA